MKIEKSDCSRCEHLRVCKWMNDYSAATKQVSAIDKNGPFVVEVKCNYYKQMTNLTHVIDDTIEI